MLTELAAQYRHSAELIRQRIEELSSAMPDDRRERIRIAQRIDKLEEQYADLVSTALQLENYYQQ